MKTLKCLVVPLVALIGAAGTVLASETTPGRPEGGAWGKPTDGLALGLVLPEKEWEYGQELPILVYVRNDGAAPLRLISLDTQASTTFRHYHDIGLAYRKEGEDGFQYALLNVPINSGDKLTELKPGETRFVRFTAANARADSPRYLNKGLVQIGAWPPTPGRYRVCASLKANGDLTKAKEAGLWTAFAESEGVELTVKPYPFLEKVREDPKLTDKEIETLYFHAAEGRQGDLEKLIELDDRRAVLALFKLMRNERGGYRIVPLLTQKFGDEITSDLVRASRAYGTVRADEAGLALGKLGTQKVIDAVQKLLTAKPPLYWSGRHGFVRGLGESKTSESLALLAKLALEGDEQAVGALAGRSEEKAADLLREVMQKGKPPADAEAARRLAGRGQIDAVRWLAAHWDWLGAAVFIRAPIQWPTPGKAEWTADKALAAAQQATLGELWINPASHAPLRNPEARYLDGKWYVVSVAGSQRLARHFVYVILDAANGKVVASDAHWVLR
jgi:hypothetical protein